MKERRIKSNTGSQLKSDVLDNIWGGAGPDGRAARRGQMSGHPVHLYARRYCSQSHPQTLLTVADTASQGRGNYHGQLWIRPSVSSFAPGCAGQPVLGLTVKGNKWERREPVCVWRSAINCLLCQGRAKEGRSGQKVIAYFTHSPPRH